MVHHQKNVFLFFCFFLFSFFSFFWACVHPHVRKWGSQGFTGDFTTDFTANFTADFTADFTGVFTGDSTFLFYTTFSHI